MQNIPDREFDNHIKKLADKHQVEFDEQAWLKMEKKLDKADREGYLIYFYKGLGILSIIGLLFYLAFVFRIEKSNLAIDNRKDTLASSDRGLENISEESSKVSSDEYISEGEEQVVPFGGVTQDEKAYVSPGKKNDYKQDPALAGNYTREEKEKAPKDNYRKGESGSSHGKNGKSATTVNGSKQSVSGKGAVNTDNGKVKKEADTVNERRSSGEYLGNSAAANTSGRDKTIGEKGIVALAAYDSNKYRGKEGTNEERVRHGEQGTDGSSISAGNQLSVINENGQTKEKDSKEMSDEERKKDGQTSSPSDFSGTDNLSGNGQKAKDVVHDGRRPWSETAGDSALSERDSGERHSAVYHSGNKMNGPDSSGNIDLIHNVSYGSTLPTGAPGEGNIHESNGQVLKAKSGNQEQGTNEERARNKEENYNESKKHDGSNIPSIHASAQDAITGQSQDSVKVLLPDSLKPSDETAKPSKQGEKVKKKEAQPGRISLGAVFAPDFSSVGFFHMEKPGVAKGVFTEYKISPRWSVMTALILTSKIYSTDGGNAYKYGYGYKKVKLESVNGNCKVLDIPVNIRYNINTSGRNIFYASAGFSSYFMLYEKYSYYYEDSHYDTCEEYKKRNKNFFSILNASAGYERFISNSFSIKAEPFIKIPLNQVGEKKLKLLTTGMFLYIKYTIR